MIQYLRIVVIAAMVGLSACATPPTTLRSCSWMSQTATATGRQCLAMAVSNERAVKEWVETHGNPDYISIKTSIREPSAIDEIVMLYLDRDLEAILNKQGDYPDRIIAHRGIEDTHVWNVDRRHRHRVHAARERRLVRTSRDVPQSRLNKECERAVASLSLPAYDIKELRSAMRSQSFSGSRGEFETIEEFEKRRKKVDQDRLYHFLLDARRFSVRYDIDSQQMRVFLPMSEHGPHLRPRPRGHSVFLADDMTTDERTGTTALGASSVYQSTRGTKHLLFITNAVEFASFNEITIEPDSRGSRERLMFPIAMDVQAARQYRDHLGLLIGVSFLDPIRFGDSIYVRRATLDWPMETSIRSEYIECILRFAVIYDTRTQTPLKTYVYVRPDEH